MPEVNLRPSLFGWAGAGDGEPLPSESASVAFEQYKLYVQLMDQISQRRQTANSFFLSLNTAVVALLGYAITEKEPLRVERFYLLISFSGLVLCLLWHRIIRSYRDLNTAKFAVIHTIETLLPLRPYTAEWDYVGRGSQPKWYKPFSHVELGVPWLFLVLYSIVFLWNVPWARL